MAHMMICSLGNPLMGDEGIGCHILSALESLSLMPHPSNTIKLQDLGTSGVHILHAIANQEKVILIDCAYMDEPPGTIRRFTPEDVESRKQNAHLSLHEGDLFRTLSISKMLGEYPEEVIIFGIQPQDVSPCTGLSPTLTANLHLYLALVLSEIMPTLAPRT